jgi:hypothetical protein
MSGKYVRQNLQPLADINRQTLANVAAASAGQPLPYSMTATDEGLGQAMDALTPMAKVGGIAGTIAGLGSKTANLPMDEASRLQRAKEMGFDTDELLYKGQSSNPTEYNPEITGNYNTADTVGTASFTPDPTQASRYAKDDVIKEWDDELGRELSNEINIGGRFIAEGANVQPVYAKNIKKIDADKQYNPEWMRQQQKIAMDEGYDGIQFLGLQDDAFYNPLGNPTDTVQIWNPAAVRSKFAKFDPKMKASKDLLAGAGAAGLLGGGLLYNPEEKY